MREAVCIASGPSLTVADVELVREWREASADRFVIVANTTFRIAPWADAMFAMDEKWWKLYREEVRRDFKGKTYCHIGNSGKGYAEMIARQKGYLHVGNSGAAILAYCCTLEFSKITMLGFDCKFSQGRKHWHADHPKMLNCASLRDWPEMFQKVRKRYRDANIVNASRQTALTMFPRVSLERALEVEVSQAMEA